MPPRKSSRTAKGKGKGHAADPEEALALAPEHAHETVDDSLSTHTQMSESELEDQVALLVAAAAPPEKRSFKLTDPWPDPATASGRTTFENDRTKSEFIAKLEAEKILANKDPAAGPTAYDFVRFGDLAARMGYHPGILIDVILALAPPSIHNRVSTMVASARKLNASPIAIARAVFALYSKANKDNTQVTYAVASRALQDALVYNHTTKLADWGVAILSATFDALHCAPADAHAFLSMNNVPGRIASALPPESPLGQNIAFRNAKEPDSDPTGIIQDFLLPPAYEATKPRPAAPAAPPPAPSAAPHLSEQVRRSPRVKPQQKPQHKDTSKSNPAPATQGNVNAITATHHDPICKTTDKTAHAADKCRYQCTTCPNAAHINAVCIQQGAPPRVNRVNRAVSDATDPELLALWSPGAVATAEDPKITVPVTMLFDTGSQPNLISSKATARLAAALERPLSAGPSAMAGGSMGGAFQVLREIRAVLFSAAKPAGVPVTLHEVDADEGSPMHPFDILLGAAGCAAMGFAATLGDAPLRPSKPPFASATAAELNKAPAIAPPPAAPGAGPRAPSPADSPPDPPELRSPGQPADFERPGSHSPAQLAQGELANQGAASRPGPVHAQTPGAQLAPHLTTLQLRVMPSAAPTSAKPAPPTGYRPDVVDAPPHPDYPDRVTVTTAKAGLTLTVSRDLLDKGADDPRVAEAMQFIARAQMDNANQPIVKDANAVIEVTDHEALHGKIPRAYVRSDRDRAALLESMAELEKIGAVRRVLMPEGSPPGALPPHAPGTTAVILPIHVIWRGDEPRVIVDARKLNAYTRVGAAAPASRPSDIVLSLSDPDAWISTADVRKAFLNCSKDLTKGAAVFYAHPDSGYWEALTILTGGVSSPGILHEYLERCLARLPPAIRKACRLFADNIWILTFGKLKGGTEALLHHLHVVRKVFEALTYTPLGASIDWRPNATQIAVRAVPALGFRAGNNGADIPPTRIAEFENYALAFPDTFGKLRTLTGQLVFLGSFVPRLASAMIPFRDVNNLKLNGSISRFEEASPENAARVQALKSAFADILDLIQHAPPLQRRNFDLPPILFVDGSKEGRAAVLANLIDTDGPDDGREEPDPAHPGRFRVGKHRCELVVVASAYTPKEEQHLSAPILELRSFAWALGKFKHLFGPHAPLVLTDSAALAQAVLNTGSDKEAAMTLRILDVLDAHGPVLIKHTPGATNPADALSRLPALAQGAHRLPATVLLRDRLLAKVLVMTLRPKPKAPQTTAATTGTTAPVATSAASALAPGRPARITGPAASAHNAPAGPARLAPAATAATTAPVATSAVPALAPGHRARTGPAASAHDAPAGPAPLAPAATAAAIVSVATSAASALAPQPPARVTGPAASAHTAPAGPAPLAPAATAATIVSVATSAVPALAPEPPARVTGPAASAHTAPAEPAPLAPATTAAATSTVPPAPDPPDAPAPLRPWPGEFFDLHGTRRPIFPISSAVFPWRPGEPAYAPASSELKDIVIRAVHDTAHVGRDATLTAIKRLGLNWPGITVDVRDHCRNCESCVTATPLPTLKAPPTVDANARHAPFHSLHMDVMYTRCAAPTQENAVVTVTDRFTGYVFGFPVREVSSAATSSALRFLFAHMGTPHEVCTDNGPENACQLTSLLADLGITHTKATPYNSTGNSLAERTIRNIRDTMRKLCDGEDPAWIPRFYEAIKAHNSRPSKLLGLSPAEMLLARRVDLGPPFTPARPAGDTEPNLAELKQAADQAREWMFQRQTITAEAAAADLARRTKPSTDPEPPPLAVGDWVLIKRPVRHKTDRFNDWPPRRVARITQGTVTLMQIDQVHVDTSRRYKLDQLVKYTGKTPEPLYFVDKLRAAKRDPKDRTRHLFLVKWRGFPGKDSWEPRENLPHTETTERQIRALLGPK
jgi:hypothetical protein